jgi:hypothetical protein
VTKVQLNYDLLRPLTDDDSKAISDVHSWYGMTRVKVAPTLDKIQVEYDASRLSEKDVEAVLLRFRIPVQRKWETT